MHHYLILNFKTYPEASGKNAVDLARIVNKLAVKTKLKLIVCPQAADIYRVREHFPHLSIWAQHIDNIAPGRNTGWTSPATVTMAGANGTLINHSEHKVSSETIQQTITICKQYHLSSCVAVPDIQSVSKIGEMSPDFLAYEPEELISGDKSLIDVDADLAQLFVTKNAKIGSKLVLGAGVKDANSVVQAFKLGYAGVLLASGFVKATDPEKFLQEMLSAVSD